MRTLYPVVLVTACCAFVLNSSAQSIGKDPSTEQQSKASTVEVGRQAAKDDVLASTELPDSPGTTLSQQAPAPSQTVPPPPSGAQAQEQQQQRPVGTAAAEAPKVSGITAAQPAGVAIAPAKQRRMRTIVLRVGAIVGAGAALGAVIALTEATPSKPPGAH
jgi:hypothetical protein